MTEDDSGVGLEIEEVGALFTREGFLRPKYTVCRANDGLNQRWYYRKDTKKVYVSVTTFLSESQPMPYGLREWHKNTPGPEIDATLKQTSEYGTFMHTVLSDFLIKGQTDLVEVANLARREASIKGHSPESWAKKIIKHLLSWAQFCHEYNVEPLAIETVLVSDKIGCAGAIDLVCFLDWPVKGFHGDVYASGARKGEPKETTVTKRLLAIIDWKSGSYFYSSYAQQIVTYEMMWKENFGRRKNGQIDLLLNWKPNDWHTSPSSTTKDQTGGADPKRIKKLAALFLEDNPGPKEALVPRGKVVLGNSTEDNYTFETISTKVQKSEEIVKEVVSDAVITSEEAIEVTLKGGSPVLDGEAAPSEEVAVDE